LLIAGSQLYPSLCHHQKKRFDLRRLGLLGLSNALRSQFVVLVGQTQPPLLTRAVRPGPNLTPIDNSNERVGIVPARQKIAYSRHPAVL
jgi:hypothetical protein